MARDDWRIRIELDDERAGGLLDRLGLDLSSRARELARELEHERLAVSRGDDTVFVYASSRQQAEQAKKIVEAELEEAGIEARVPRLEHWLEAEERWDDEPKHETWEEAVLERGYAPWEVRVECRSHKEAESLAGQLGQEGYDVVRGWRYLILGASTREEAEALGEKLHGTVEPGGELVWEVLPQNPFAVFGGLGG